MPSLFETMWKDISQFFVAMWENVWGGLVDIADVIWDKGWGSLKKAFASTETAHWNQLLDEMISDGIIQADIKPMLMKLKDMSTGIDVIAYFLILSTGYGNYLKTYLSGSFGETQRSVNAKFRPTILRPEEMIAAALIAPEKAGEIKTKLKEYGLKDDDIDLLFLNLYASYDEQRVRDLYLRKIIDATTMRTRMRELGFTDTRIDELVQSWEIIPGPSDLFHLVAREAFEPETIRLLGLDAEYPDDQTEWLEKQGVSPDWARKYWIAHWDQPSIQQGYEMLHRGEIDLEILHVLFKTVEIPPYWRDKLTNVAFIPYTRVDVRRMHAMGTINDEGLIRAYMDLGFNEEKATGMAEFTKAYNRQSEKDLTKSQLLKGYNEGILPKVLVEELMLDMKYSQAEVDYIITLEDMKKAQAHLDKRVDKVGWRYINNFSDADKTIKELNLLNLPGERIKELMDDWDIDKFEDMKMPSKADLDKFFKSGIIDEERYKTQMFLIGFNNEYTDWYLQLIQIQQGAK